MKRLFFLLTITFAFTQANAQMPVMESITEQICDSLNQMPPAKVKQLVKIDYQLLMSTVIFKQSLPWTKEMIAFKEKSGRSTADYESYFNHYLETICPIYREVAHRLDPYLEEAELERQQYLTAKAFVGHLEDEAKNDVLLGFFNEDLQQAIKPKDLDALKQEIQLWKGTTILSIMLVNGNLFRARYVHCITNEPLLQIDLIFEDLSDLKVDAWEIKEKKELVKENK